jgi:hypothetical protein
MMVAAHAEALGERLPIEPWMVNETDIRIDAAAGRW